MNRTKSNVVNGEQRLVAPINGAGRRKGSKAIPKTIISSNLILESDFNHLIFNRLNLIHECFREKVETNDSNYDFAYF